jgi:outer membrane immunogenic protein
MFRKLILSAVLAVAATVGAVAADAPMNVTYDPSLQPSDWTGFYAGVWAGGRVSNVNNTACIGVCADDFGINGFTGGVTAGYDHQVSDNIVLGGFVTIPVVRPTTVATIAAFPGPTWTVEPQFALVAGARVGFVHGNMMPYALAGLGLASVTVTPSFPGTTASTATHVGGVFGGGAEFKLNDSWSIDTRYMLGVLGDATYSFCPAPGCSSSYNEVSHNFSVGVNYRF